MKPNEIGSYIIDYNLNYNNQNFVIKRELEVVDLIKPVLSLSSDSITMDYCSKKVKKEITYQAKDNYDGDITDNVVITEENNKRIYSVSDSSGNIEQKEITIIYEKKPNDKFYLNGSSTMNINLNSSFTDPGAKYTDGCGKAIEADIVVSGEVDPTTEGTYEITYSLNGKTLRRQVIVSEKKVQPKTIYLTFDDGPGAYTSKLLNILDKYNVKATFFVTNQFGSSTYQKLIAREARSGHSVCIHSYTHQFSIYKSVDTYFNDLNKMNNLIEKQTGKKSKCVRFPGGSSNTVSRKYKKGIMTTLANELGSRGYRYYDWNLDSGDTNVAKSANAVASRVKKNLKGGTYNILMHDIKSYTVNAIEEIIKYGLANGYTFLPITDGSPTFHQRINN
jgi:peptidoglycan/xylan/chitin deacetylase (PgdA/CDA1 family)